MADLEGLRFETENKLEAIRKQKVEIEKKLLDLSSKKITFWNAAKVAKQMQDLLITLGCIEVSNLSDLETVHTTQLDLFNIIKLFQKQLDVLNGE